MRVIYYLVIFIHLLVVFIISSIPLFFLLGVLVPLVQFVGFLVVCLTAISGLIFKFRCPLTLLQRKIESKLGIQKGVRSFVQELFLKLKIKVSEGFVRVLTILFLFFDFLFLLMVKY